MHLQLLPLLLLLLQLPAAVVAAAVVVEAQCLQRDGAIARCDGEGGRLPLLLYCSTDYPWPVS